RRDWVALAQLGGAPNGRRHDLVRINAYRRQRRRMNITDRHRLDRALLSLGVRLAQDHPAADAAARQSQAETVWPVIAAGEAVDLRRSAELAHAHHHCPAEQVPLL